MTIELWVNGDIKKIWVYASEFQDMRGELGYKKREAELQEKIQDIIQSPEFILKTLNAEHWELQLRVNSSLRASDVVDDNPLLNKGDRY